MRFQLYKKTIFPLLLVLSGGCNHLLVLAARWIFLKDEYGTVSYTHLKGLKVIGLLGRDGGRIRGYSDTAIVVPEQETFKIQELHLPVYHALCLMLEEYFF